jgi:hypothetical protein
MNVNVVDCKKPDLDKSVDVEATARAVRSAKFL